MNRISEMAKKNNKKKVKKEVKETPKVEEEKTTIVGSFPIFKVIFRKEGGEACRNKKEG